MSRKMMLELYIAVSVLIVVTVLTMLTDLDKVVLDMLGWIFKALFDLFDMMVKDVRL